MNTRNQFGEMPFPEFEQDFEVVPSVQPARKPPEEPHYTNHRQRLRGRFMRAGATALADYEMLELVLFRAIPRRDVKPIAKRLLAEFGDFNRVITAPASRLAKVQGVGTAAVQELKIVEAAAQMMGQARVLGQNAITSWSSLMEYCKTIMAHRETEQFRVLYLDRKNVLIADEAQASGTVDHVPVYPREVVKRALELNASSLILVHNHPSGSPDPSDEDILMTNRIAEAAEALGISVHDHIVIGKERDASFKALGLI